MYLYLTDLIDRLRQSLGQLRNRVQSDKTQQQQGIKTLQDNYRSMQTRLSNLERSVAKKKTEAKTKNNRPSKWMSYGNCHFIH